MNILTDLISLVYLAIGLSVVIFVADYSGFDNEFGTAYHKYVKAPLIKHKVLKKRRGNRPSYKQEKEE